jgi:hypothetical protein
MSNKLALRELEKKAWLRTFEHGLWDIGIGSMFLMFGLTIIIDFPAFSAIWIAAMMPAFRELGRKLVVPRIGHVQFRARRKLAKGRLRGMLAVVMLLGIVFFLFFTWMSRGTSPAWAQWISDHFVIFIGLVWGGALAATGKLVDFPRLYAYGVLVFGSLIVTDLIEGYHLGISLSLVGGIILLAGIILFTRFIRRYPKLEDGLPETSNG